MKAGKAEDVHSDIFDTCTVIKVQHMTPNCTVIPDVESFNVDQIVTIVSITYLKGSMYTFIGGNITSQLYFLPMRILMFSSD